MPGSKGTDYCGRNSGVETPLNFYLIKPIIRRADRKPVQEAAKLFQLAVKSAGTDHAAKTNCKCDIEMTWRIIWRFDFEMHSSEA